MISFLILSLQFFNISFFSGISPIEKKHLSLASLSNQMPVLTLEIFEIRKSTPLPPPSNQIPAFNSFKSFLLPPEKTDLTPKKRLFSNFSKTFKSPLISPKISTQNKAEETKITKSSPLFSMNKNIKKASFSTLESLNQFMTENDSGSIHNTALTLLNSENREPALLLLRRNFYHNLFFPSYFVISQLNQPVSFTPLLWHISLLLLSLAGFCLLLLYFLQPHPFLLKIIGGNLFVFGCILFAGFFLLKERASPLQETSVHSLPFPSSSVEMNVTATSDLVILEKNKDWLRVENPEKQMGWIPKKTVFQTF